MAKQAKQEAARAVEQTAVAEAARLAEEQALADRKTTSVKVNLNSSEWKSINAVAKKRRRSISIIVRNALSRLDDVSLDVIHHRDGDGLRKFSVKAKLSEQEKRRIQERIDTLNAHACGMEGKTVDLRANEGNVVWAAIRLDNGI